MPLTGTPKLSLSIKTKFAGLVITATLASCLAVGILSYQIGRNGLVEASQLRLESIAGNQAKKLMSYEDRIKQSLADISQNTALGQAVETMTNVIPADAPAIKEEFQKADKSPAARAAFDGADLKLLYAIHHAGIHGTLANAWKNSGVTEIYVINEAGTIVYTVTKGKEFLANVTDSPRLKEMVERLAARPLDATEMSGFAAYPSGEGGASALIGRSLAVASWGKVLKKGTVIIRVSADALAAAVKPDDLGKSADDALLVSNDGTLRAGASTRGDAQVVPSDIAAASVAGAHGTTLTRSGGQDVLYTHLPVTVFGQKHLLAIGQSEEKVLAAANDLAFYAVVATLAVVLVMGLGGTLAAARLIRPMVDLADLMKRLNDGDKTITIAASTRRDEIGKMGRALESFRQGLIDKERVELASLRQTEQLDVERRSRDAERASSARDIEFAVSSIGGALASLAGGQLHERINTPFSTELDHLRHDFNNAVSGLEAAIAAIGQSAEAIHVGSQELRTAGDDLAKRTERQAATLEEAAAALGDMTVTVNGALKYCETASGVAEDTLHSANASANVVGDAMQAMKRIEDSSSKIRQIIDVIDQIAFQTNLLALNAGVEAARAGEAGKGFAVVAQEVRELAQKSAAAARDIGQLINTSASDVENGVALVLKTGDSLGVIQRNIHSIHDYISGIVKSSREQSSRLDEINAAVGALDQVTQQNAAMVEETTAAAHSLSSEADRLNEQVAHFSTAEPGNGVQPGLRRRAA
jgi:methyl-accepting chemotaxis protein